MNQDDWNSLFDSDRRHVLALFGASGMALLTRNSLAQNDSRPVWLPDNKTPACVLTPKQTEGPFFFDRHLNRSDIRIDSASGNVKPGAPLALSLRVSAIGSNGCGPLPNAMVDIWQCDAAGVYSDVGRGWFASGGGDTSGQDFLRGYQMTDAAGQARFMTIYPGWYRGRAVHIHYKVRAKAGSGRHLEFTSQLYFDEATNDRVFSQAPYVNKGQGRERNDEDSIFRSSGHLTTLSVVPLGQGYGAVFDVGVQMT